MMKNKMAKYAFLFGAGAEFDLGMPTGDNFAKKVLFDKGIREDAFGEVHTIIDGLCKANPELYKDFAPKNIPSFDDINELALKEELGTVKFCFRTASTRKKITHFLNNIDEHYEYSSSSAKDEREDKEKRVKEIFQPSKKYKYDDQVNVARLYESNFLSDFKKKKKDDVDILKIFLSALIYVSEENTKPKDFNKGKFYEKFKNIIGIRKSKKNEETENQFYSSIKQTEIVTLYMLRKIQGNYNSGSTYMQLLIHFYETILDEQDLLGLYYNCLFKNDIKFKILGMTMIFAAKNVIKSDSKNANLSASKNYYSELKNETNIKQPLIATTNYTDIIKKNLGEEVKYLNGSTDTYINLETLKIEDSEPKGVLYVPFIFTQAYIKPIVSINIMDYYKDFFEELCNYDVLAIVGWNCNPDEVTINSILHDFLSNKDKETNKDKKIVFFAFCDKNKNGYKSETEFANAKHAELCKALHLSDKDPRLFCVPINGDHKVYYDYDGAYKDDWLQGLISKKVFLNFNFKEVVV